MTILFENKDYFFFRDHGCIETHENERGFLFFIKATLRYLRYVTIRYVTLLHTAI